MAGRKPDSVQATVIKTVARKTARDALRQVVRPNSLLGRVAGAAIRFAITEGSKKLNIK